MALQAAMPNPPTDAALRTSIAERFAGAYEAQLGYLARVAQTEQEMLQHDIFALRNASYVAQGKAAEHRARTEGARRAIGAAQQDCNAMREALGHARSLISSEANAYSLSQERLGREESTLAELKRRTHEEVSELQNMCAHAAQRRQEQEQRAIDLTRQLAEARQDRINEAQAAQDHDLRAQQAARARDQALAELRHHEEVAVNTLKEAVSKLERDFERERADFAARAQRANAQVQELERHLDQRRRPGVWLPTQ